MWETRPVKPPSGVALLLSQLGALSSARFAARLKGLGLTPAHMGVLRVVGQNPGLNQQEVAQRLGAAPSRVVKLVDELEERGLVTRTRSDQDRRNYLLHTNADAADTLAAARAAAAEHDAEITAALSPEEVEQLRDLLAKLSDGLGMPLGAHPGYGSGPPGGRASTARRHTAGGRPHDGPA